MMIKQIRLFIIIKQTLRPFLFFRVAKKKNEAPKDKRPADFQEDIENGCKQRAYTKFASG